MRIAAPLAFRSAQPTLGLFSGEDSGAEIWIAGKGDASWLDLDHERREKADCVAGQTPFGASMVTRVAAGPGSERRGSKPVLSAGGLRIT